MTKNSEAVLAALEAKKIPSSVADLAGLLEGRCDLATVYRSLHRLEAEGLVEAFAFECRERGIERYYLSRRRPHRHFFHCESCHRFIDLGECRLGGIVEELEREFDLEVESHTLYLTGRCKACAAAARTRDSLGNLDKEGASGE